MSHCNYYFINLSNQIRHYPPPPPLLFLILEDYTLFCIFFIDLSDQNNHTVTSQSQLNRCQINRGIWSKLQSETMLRNGYSENQNGQLNGQSNPMSLMFETIQSALTWSRTKVLLEGHTTGADHRNGYTLEEDCRNSYTMGADSTNGHTIGTEFTNGHTMGAYSINGHMMGAYSTNGHTIGTEITNGHTMGEESTNGHTMGNTHIHLLCTGSIHLLGGILRMIDPEYCTEGV